MGTESKIELARRLGRESWRLRLVLRCPYPPGELADAWHGARDEARRASHRPEVIEVKIPVKNAVDLLNLHFRGRG